MRILIACTVLVWCASQLVFGQCRPSDMELIDSAYYQRDEAPVPALAIIQALTDSLRSSNRTPCYPHLGEAYLVQGMILRNLHYFAEALSSLEQARAIREDTLQDVVGTASVFNIISTVEKERGQYDEALIASRRAIDLLNDYREDRDSRYWRYLGSFYINLSNILIEADSLDSVEEYIELAKTLLRHSDQSEEAAFTADYNLSLAYIELERYAEAQSKLQACLRYYQEQEDIAALALMEDALGSLDHRRGAYGPARLHFQQSIDYYEALRDRTKVKIPQLNLATNYLQEGYPDTAIYLAGQLYFDSREQVHYARRLERLYIDAYSQTGNLEKMAEHLFVLDTIIQIIYENTPKYFNRRAVALQPMARATAANADHFEQVQMAKYLVLGIMVILIMLAFFFGLKRLKAQKLAKENENQERRFQSKIAEILYEKKTLVNSRIHDEICPRIVNVKRELEHFIHSNAKDPDSLLSIIKLIDDVYGNAKSLIDRTEYEAPQTNWYDNLHQIIEQTKRVASFKLNDQINVKPEQVPVKIGEQLATITNVLLENIELHARAKEASIDIIRENGTIQMIVEDDGDGITPDPQNKGIGLKNVKYRIKKILNGKIKIDSAPQRGTSIAIEIPIH